MATNYHYFTGKVKWAKVHRPDQKYGKYSLNFYPDKETIKAIKAAGVASRQKVDENEDNAIFYTFRRDPEKEIKGEMVQFGPPKVIDKDGNPLDKMIGNGSICTIKLSVYDTQMGKGSRLEAVRVDELIEYNPENKTGTDNGLGVPF